MYQVQQITSDANQQQTLVLPDGRLIKLSMRYSPQQYGWFCDIQFGSVFAINGLRVTTSPNMFRQWKNKIPFGLGVITTNSQEPTQLEDFSSGFAKMYVLSAADVLAYEEYLQGG